MANRFDMCGFEYDLIKVLEYSHSDNGVYWKCICACGNRVDIRRSRCYGGLGGNGMIGEVKVLESIIEWCGGDKSCAYHAGLHNELERYANSKRSNQAALIEQLQQRVQELEIAIDHSLRDMEYAAFNLCESMNLDSENGGRTVETTCPEKSLLIAIRDLKEAMGAG